MPSKPTLSAYSSWSMYSWYIRLALAGSKSLASMSTHTEWCFSRKSSGRCGHGIRLNQVNFTTPPRERLDAHATSACHWSRRLDLVGPKRYECLVEDWGTE